MTQAFPSASRTRDVRRVPCAAPVARASARRARGRARLGQAAQLGRRRQRSEKPDSPPRVEHVVPANSTSSGLAPARLVGVEVLRGDEAAALVHERRAATGERALVGAAGALVGQSARAPPRAPAGGAGRPACESVPSGRVDPRRPRSSSSPGASIAEAGACAGGIGDAVAGEPQRRLDEPPPGKRAVRRQSASSPAGTPGTPHDADADRVVDELLAERTSSSSRARAPSPEPERRRSSRDSAPRRAASQ